MSDLSACLSERTESGYIVAPAGFGKTHLIVKSVAHTCRRKLILTHTHAGVNAIKQKMRHLGVKPRHAQVTTIASWALKVSLAYSGTSSWTCNRPPTNQQWEQLYTSCTNLLNHQFCKDILRASYEQVYVDEYQDCSKSQHNIILKIADVLPVLILGDPLQGIFDFGENCAIDWVQDVAKKFELVGELEKPHRWMKNGALELGEWLKKVRRQLENDQPIELNPDCRIEGLNVKLINSQELRKKQYNTCRYFKLKEQQSVIAIHGGSQQFKHKCQKLAQNLLGRFKAMEEVEGKDLFKFVRNVGKVSTDNERLKAVVNFAATCMTGVNACLSKPITQGKEATIDKRTKSPEAARAANIYLYHPTSENMLAFLREIKAIEDVKIYRADLYDRLCKVLRLHQANPNLTFLDAAEQFQKQFRFRGRVISPRRQIGTTLLVKGLEYDHAIVLDATSLSKKELYVALTRGADSLTVISTEPVLNPK